MPGNRGGPTGEEGMRRSVASTAMDQVDFWIALWGSTCGMDVMPAKVAAVFQRLTNWQIGKVLVAKRYDFAPCYQERQLIFAFVGQRAKLDARDFRSDRRGEILFLDAWLEKVWKCRIGIAAMFMVLERLKSFVLLVEVPCG